MKEKVPQIKKFLIENRIYSLKRLFQYNLTFNFYKSPT